MNNDLISRKYMKEAIEQFFEMVKYYHPHSKGKKTIPTEEVLDIIDTAPAVEPQGKWGKWVISEIQCPNCFEYFQTDCYSTEELNKCPSCGADMRQQNKSAD